MKSRLWSVFKRKTFLYTGRKNITGELHGTKQIVTDFNFETKHYFLVTFCRFPGKLDNNIKNFKKQNDVPLIPKRIFDDQKTISFHLPF